MPTVNLTYLSNYKILYIITLFFSSIFLYKLSYAVNNNDTINNMEQYRPGLLLFQSNRLTEAGQNWLRLGESLLIETKDSTTLKQAAFAYILASIAYEKTSNPIAYTSWATAIQYYLQGQTTWNTEREKINTSLKNYKQKLDLIDPDLGQPALSNNELLLILIHDTLDIQQYNGPKPGLGNNADDKNETLNISRDYFARPLALINEETQAVESRSKYTNIETEENEDTEFIVARGLRNITENQPDLEETESPLILVNEQTLENIGFINEERQNNTTIENENYIEDDEDNIQSTAEENIGIKPLIAELPAIKNSEKTKEINYNPVPQIRTDPVSYQTAFTDQHLKIARTAWRYFIHNRQQNTGLYNSVNQYKRATLWDIGSTLAGIVSAEQLGLLDRKQFNKDIQIIINTLKQLPLYNNELPNREYTTDTGKMIDLRNRSSLKGSGWSALDIGRTLIWLRIIRNWYPNFKTDIETLVKQWNFDRLANNDYMNGTWFNGKNEKLRQEGRLGYEQYAAAGFELWNIKLPNAFDYDRIEEIDILGITVPYDTRVHSYLTSEPFFLGQLELGSIDEKFEKIADTIFNVQKKRWQEFDILTAFSEDSINENPWFLYNNIYDHKQKKFWSCVSHTGKPVQQCGSVSNKTAFAWYAIYHDNDYAQVLKNTTKDLLHPKYGYYAGLYEDGSTNKALTINTNSIILEAMLYIKRGGKPFITFKRSNHNEVPTISRGNWNE